MFVCTTTICNMSAIYDLIKFVKKGRFPKNIMWSGDSKRTGDFSKFFISGLRGTKRTLNIY